MKLDAKTIRERASAIIYKDAQAKDSIEQVLKLIEDATGEKIPKPFDKSKVTHGSVWVGLDKVIVIEDGSSTSFNPMYHVFRFSSCGDFIEQNGPLTKPNLVERLANMEHIGQYDFSAGLPKT